MLRNLIRQLFLSSTLMLCVAAHPAKAASAELVALGGLVVDHLALIDDEFLTEIGGEKYGSAEINYTGFQDILNCLQNPPTQMPGGSAVNQLTGLTALGHKTKLMTCRGSDELGDLSISSLRKLDIDVKFVRSKQINGRTLCLVTPNCERTIRWHDNSIEALDRLNFELADFKGTRVAHIEGYRYPNHDLVTRFAETAKAAGCLISLDLGSHETVQGEKAFLQDFIPQFIDILYCNAEEAYTLTGESPADAAACLAQDVSIAVVTNGEVGCYIATEDTQYFVPGRPAFAIDTTGAGDFFAAGFMHGFLSGLPLNVCGDFGHIVASRCVENFGAYLREQQYHSAQEDMQSVMDSLDL